MGPSNNIKFFVGVCWGLLGFVNLFASEAICGLTSLLFSTTVLTSLG